jgi:hypothetical protein
VLAFLERREELGPEFVEAGPKPGSTPEEQLLAIFDVFDEWFRREDFEACSFINVLLEMGIGTRPGTPACVISRTSDRWFAASPRRPACETPPPSPARGTS